MSDDRIYLDNAATSWPKPESVYEAVDHAMRVLGAPAGRSSYREANEVERLVGETRRKVARLLGCPEARRIVFTANGTDSLNLALWGLLRSGDHVITSVAEHNSVLRPLRALEEDRQIAVTRVPCDGEGRVDPADIRHAIRSETRLIALVHASNVTGTLQPVQEVGRIAREHGLLYLVDAAQTLGSLPISVDQLNCSLLAAPGHKGLLGPLGTGVLYIAPHVETQLRPVRQGGTGTVSEQDHQPETLPEGYESGNHNVPGILGLGAALDWLVTQSVASLQSSELQLIEHLLGSLGEMEGVRVWGPPHGPQRVGVISFTLDGYAPQEVADMLDSTYRIQVRAGLHCAPLIHQSLGTLSEGGTVRLSVGPFNTRRQMDAVVEAIGELAASEPAV